MNRNQAILLSVLPTLFFCSSSAGQEKDSGTSDREKIKLLADSIAYCQEELVLLQHFLEASTVDPRLLYYTNVKSWVISNPALRDSLFFALMEADSSIQAEAGSGAEVLATDSNDLIEVRFGTAVFKGITLKDALNKSGDGHLYRRVAESHKYSKDIELRDPAQRLPTEFEPELIGQDELLRTFVTGRPNSNPNHTRGTADLSLYRVAFSIGPSWGGEVRIGNDEIGLPFWSSGKMAFLAAYKRIKFGFELPFHPGRNTSELVPPFTLRGRKLNGTRGILGEFDFGSVGGLLSITRLTSHDTHALTDPSGFYYITGMLQLYYSFGISLNPTDLVRLKLGLGVHRINKARLEFTPAETIIPRPHTDFVSPYLKFEYLNKGINDRFVASVQFYDLVLLLGGSVEIVPGVVSLEAKYAWQVAPNLREWQNPGFFIVSPRVQFAF